MKTFQEWLEESDREIYSEIDWKKMGRNLALGGALLAPAITGCAGGVCPTEPTASQSAQDAISQADYDIKMADAERHLQTARNIKRSREEARPVSKAAPSTFSYRFGGPRKATAEVKAYADHGEVKVTFIGSKVFPHKNRDMAEKYARHAILKASGLSKGNIRGFRPIENNSEAHNINMTFQWDSVD